MIGELMGKQVLLGKTLRESTQKFREARIVLPVPWQGSLAQGSRASNARLRIWTSLVKKSL